MVHMEPRNDGTRDCAECQHMKEYDYGNRIHCCDHAERTDDMGKLGVGNMPRTSPEWCTLRD